MFTEELFGEVGEEKEVQGIVSKLMEARSTKSYESYRLVARLVSKTSLALLVTPLKQVGRVKCVVGCIGQSIVCEGVGCRVGCGVCCGVCWVWCVERQDVGWWCLL